MQIVITYDDGTEEVVAARLEGDVVSVGMDWIPGVLVDEPERCYFKSDYFCCAINEGQEREGVVRPEPCDMDPDTGVPDWSGFAWKLLGNEADECRTMIRRWIGSLQGNFDPEREGAEYLHGGLLQVLDDDEVAKYNRDRQCWLAHLDDARYEAASLLQDAGLEPPQTWNAGAATGPR